MISFGLIFIVFFPAAVVLVKENTISIIQTTRKHLLHREELQMLFEHGESRRGKDIHTWREKCRAFFAESSLRIC
jgi:hypothetical protein